MSLCTRRVRVLRSVGQPGNKSKVSQVSEAAIAQLGERQTEDLKVPGSIPGLGILAQKSGILAQKSH